MSGLFDSRADGSSRREARTQKEKQAKKKTRIIAVTVITVLALLFVSALIINSRFIRRNLTAITIDGISFSATEFDYFFNNAFLEYRNLVLTQMPDFADSLLPAGDRVLSSQMYNQETGETWADFFADRAIQAMTELVQLYNAAVAAGFVLPDDKREEIESEITRLRLDAGMYGFPSLDSLIQEMFGNSINEASLRSILEFELTASAFNESVRDSFTYSETELSEYYDENRDDLDIFTYRAFLLQSDPVEEWQFESSEEFEAARDAASAGIAHRAAQIVVAIESEDDFIAAASEYDEMYSDPQYTLVDSMGEALYAIFRDWLIDPARVSGDVEAFYTEAGVYIVYFVSRNNNNYNMAGMRQILMLREDVMPDGFFLESEADIEDLAALADADRRLRERAESVHALFIAGGATESLLIELTAEHSDDLADGLYTEIARFSYQSRHMADVRSIREVPEIEQWLFDGSRQIGDSELIYTEAFGYHLLYFTGYGERFSDFIAADRMRGRDHMAWLEGFEEDVGIVRHWALALTEW